MLWTQATVHAKLAQCLCVYVCVCTNTLWHNCNTSVLCSTATCTVAHMSVSPCPCVCTQKLRQHCNTSVLCSTATRDMHACMHACIHTYIHASHYIHYITFTLHYITVQYITLHVIYIPFHSITLHYITLHYITLHCITLHYVTFTLHTYIQTYIHTCITM